MKPDELKLDDIRMQVLAALQEDIGAGDITTDNIVAPQATAHAEIVAKQDGTLAGIGVAETVFTALDPQAKFEKRIEDGADFTSGDVLAAVEGEGAALLKAERTALNFLQRLTGIATLTHRFVEAVAGTEAQILDTRKTTPGWRALEKYAVRCGGGVNHRMGLYDAVLIKENHIRMAAESGRTIKQTLDALREKLGAEVFVEIEAHTLNEVAACLASTPDCILLDNMSTAEMQQAVLMGRKTNDKVLFEASGNVSLDTVAEIAATGVHRISIGALTHSAPAADVSLLFK